MVDGDSFKDYKTREIYKVIEIKDGTILVESERDSKRILKAE